MRSLPFFALFTIGISACHTDQPLDSRSSIAGTYEITRLTQYQNGKKTFEGYLPYLLNDSITITHRLGISLGNGSTDGTDVYIIQSLVQNTNRFTRTTGKNIGGLNIKIKATQSPLSFEFYRGGIVKIGQYNAGALSFDLVEKDTLNQDTRYVFEAKKVSDIPNRF